MAPKLGGRRHSGKGGGKGADDKGTKSGHEIPGKGVIVQAVNRAGAFPKRYKGLKWKDGEDPWPNMVRGKIGEDLAERSAKMRGERVVASQVKVHNANAKSTTGSSNIDHVVKKPDGKYEGVEVKTGDATLSDGQSAHYPNVPKGGLKVMTDKLQGEGIKSGSILRPGEISGVRLERWDIDSMPPASKQLLDRHTIGDILDGKAGRERAEELRNWMQSGSAYKIERRWT